MKLALLSPLVAVLSPFWGTSEAHASIGLAPSALSTTGLPAVQNTGLPAVQNTGLPAVQITGLPAVQ